MSGTGGAPPIAGAAGTPGMTERFDHDGETRLVQEADLVPGTVVRILNAVVPSSSGGRQVAAGFSDCLVLSGPESKAGDGGARYVRLARPYAFVSGADTASPTVLTGYEPLEVPVGRLTGPGSPFRTVLRSTGAPQTATT